MSVAAKVLQWQITVGRLVGNEREVSALLGNGGLNHLGTRSPIEEEKKNLLQKGIAGSLRVAK